MADIGGEKLSDVSSETDDKDRSDCLGAIGYFGPLGSHFDTSTITTSKAELYYGGIILALVPPTR